MVDVEVVVVVAVAGGIFGVRQGRASAAEWAGMAVVFDVVVMGKVERVAGSSSLPAAGDRRRSSFLARRTRDTAPGSAAAEQSSVVAAAAEVRN